MSGLTIIRSGSPQQGSPEEEEILCSSLLRVAFTRSGRTGILPLTDVLMIFSRMQISSDTKPDRKVSKVTVSATTLMIKVDLKFGCRFKDGQGSRDFFPGKLLG